MHSTLIINNICFACNLNLCIWLIANQKKTRRPFWIEETSVRIAPPVCPQPRVMDHSARGGMQSVDRFADCQIIVRGIHDIKRIHDIPQFLHVGTIRLEIAPGSEHEDGAACLHAVSADQKTLFLLPTARCCRVCGPGSRMTSKNGTCRYRGCRPPRALPLQRALRFCLRNNQIRSCAWGAVRRRLRRTDMISVRMGEHHSDGQFCDLRPPLWDRLRLCRYPRAALPARRAAAHHVVQLNAVKVFHDLCGCVGWHRGYPTVNLKIFSSTIKHLSRSKWIAIFKLIKSL